MTEKTSPELVRALHVLLNLPAAPPPPQPDPRDAEIARLQAALRSIAEKKPPAAVLGRDAMKAWQEFAANLQGIAYAAQHTTPHPR